MATRRRGGLSGWLSRLSSWQLVLGFIVLAVGAGAVTLTALTGFERRYGVAAQNFGFARTVHLDELRAEQALKFEEQQKEQKQDIAKLTVTAERTQLWILYDQIKRTQRNIDNLKDKKALTPVEREQLQDFGTQLTEATSDYQKLVEKVKAAQ